MITVYGIRSPYVYRVRAALVKKGLDFEHVNVDMKNRSEELMSVSPLGKIPAMQDGDLRIWDSRNIVEYLDEQYPETYKMMGESKEDRIAVKNALAIIDNIAEVAPALFISKMDLHGMFHEARKGHRAPKLSNEQMEHLDEEIQLRLKQLQELKQGKFFASRYSHADASLLAMLPMMEKFGVDVSSWDSWKEELMQDASIAGMFPPEEEKGVRNI